jgi:hypothetical protein
MVPPIAGLLAALLASPPAAPSGSRAHQLATELRDPFVDGAAVPSARPISADLKDPFAPRAGGNPVPSGPIRDLRDPFEPRPGALPPGVCATASGVPVQRPKALRGTPSRCAGSDAPLLDPFAAA